MLVAQAVAVVLAEGYERMPASACGGRWWRGVEDLLDLALEPAGQIRGVLKIEEVLPDRLLEPDTPQVEQGLVQ